MWEHATVRPRSLTHTALVLCLGLFCAAGAVYASGQGEERLDEARQLIQAKEFDQALLLLVEIERENPDMQDETRALMFQIHEMRARVDTLMEKILDALSENDAEKALALINELKALDPKSTAKIATAEDAVIFIVNENHVHELMDAALKKLEEKKYAEAITLYLEPLKYPGKNAGFDLHRQEFMEAGHGEMAEQDILNRATELIALSESAAAAENHALESARAAAAALSAKRIGESELEAFEQALARIRSVADMESILRERIASLSRAGNTLAEANADKRVDFYIQYMILLCSGRKDRNEGIFRAIRLMWDDAAARAAEDALSGVDSAFAAGIKLFESDDYAGMTAAFQDIPNRSIAAVAALALRGAAFELDQGWNPAAMDVPEIEKLLGEAAGAQEKAAESRAFIVLGRLTGELAGLEPKNAMVADLRSLRTSLRARITEAESLRREWEGRRQDFAEKAKLVSSIEDTRKSAEEMAARFAFYLDDLEGKDLACAIVIAESEFTAFDPRLKNAVEQQAEAQDLITGTVDGQPSSSAPKRPSQALVILQNEINALQALQRDIGSYSRAWNSDASYVSGSDEVKRLVAGAEGIAALAAEEIAAVQEDYAKAQEQHANAVEYSRQGTQYFERAVALVKTDPEEASNLISLSYEAYGKSLQFEEDDAIRKRTGANGDLSQLLAQIQTALNARIITDVENLISAGIKLVTNGDNVNAYQKFIQADQRWQEKHPGEAYSNVLTYYLELSRTASSVSGSRDIPPTDPSYKVVSSYLNLANGSFLEAEKLIKSGKTVDARKHLESSKQNVDSVLSLFPYNRAAQVLDLKIVKITGEKEFPSKLKALMDGFIRDSKSPNMADKQAAYLGLKNLQEFLPKDAALAKIIKSLGQEIGVEAKPISQANILKSTQFYQQARANYNTRRSETWQPSINMLDEALGLNPNNEDARTLRKTILLRTGDIKEIPVKPNVLAEYSKAKELFNKKDYISARQIVDTLLLDPSNATFTPLIDLKQRLIRIQGF